MKYLDANKNDQLTNNRSWNIQNPNAYNLITSTENYTDSFVDKLIEKFSSKNLIFQETEGISRKFKSRSVFRPAK